MVTLSPCHLVQLGISISLEEGVSILSRVCSLLYALTFNYSGDVVHMITVLCQKANIFNQLFRQRYNISPNDLYDPNDHLQ